MINKTTIAILSSSLLMLGFIAVPLQAETGAVKEKPLHNDHVLIKEEVDDTDIYTIQLGEDEEDIEEEMDHMEAEQKEYQEKHHIQPK